jgi:hypothetical protein
MPRRILCIVLNFKHKDNFTLFKDIRYNITIRCAMQVFHDKFTYSMNQSKKYLRVNIIIKE